MSCLYYFWRQATQLPEWYTTETVDGQETVDLSNESEIIAAKARLQAKIDASITKAEVADTQQ
ncbi:MULTISPECIES: hypothetical protein [unclassified Coleofasciculus]|uniref:hypothetical protein n=1 Tax=unclassified Coleofasciculus TaxID=2692782 RepID=UPI0018818A0F|nr:MULTISPECIES: hypothetical protein [unclassified Coleofasciculus]MBE9129745.1 hypothetical protein [Coleofasciculus sp. LEGE 07081]MBE9152236.1 hypothetical protein [Coleofasciculus sp. LEGE 07092]